MSLNSADRAGSGVGAERAPRLEGAGDYASWRARISAHLQARGAQDAHRRVMTAKEHTDTQALIVAWDVEEDARSRALAAAALPMKAEPALAKPEDERRLAEQVTIALDARRHVRAQMQRAAMAYGVLFGALPDELQLQARHIAEGHAHGLWSWLETKFQNTDRDNVAALWQQWTTLQQEPEQSFDAHRARVTQALSLLAHAGQHVSTEQQLHALIDRLRPEYRLATLALKNGALIKDAKLVKRTVELEEAAYDFNAIANFLNAHERAEQRADGVSEVAAAAMRQRGQYPRSGRQQQQGDNDVAGERQPPWLTQPCWTCGKVGHPARRCTEQGSKSSGGNGGRFGRNDRGRRNERASGSRADDSSDGEIISVLALVGSLPDEYSRGDYDTDEESSGDDERHAAFAAADRTKLKRMTRGAEAPERPEQKNGAGAATKPPDAQTSSQKTAAAAKPAAAATPQPALKVREETPKQPRIVAPTTPNKPGQASAGAGQEHWLTRGTGPSLGIDTMCSIHCTNNKKLFAGKLRAVAPVQVTVANGEIVEVSRAGTLMLSVLATKEGGSGKVHKKEFRVEDVYYHPTFATTLVSWGKLFTTGWKLRAGKDTGNALVSPGGWQIKLGYSSRLLMMATDNRETVMAAPTSGKQTAMAVNVVGEQCLLVGHAEVVNSATSGGAALLREHERLGHMAADALIKFVKARASDGVPELTQQQLTDGRQAVLDCVACMEGKMTRSDFGHGGLRHGTAPCEVLHFDTFEQRVRHADGTIVPEYHLVGIDDWSKQRWHEVTRLKSDLAGALLDVLRSARTQFDARIKVLHSDGGSEFINAAVLAYCAAEGIELIRPPPGTQRLNGVAERNVATIKTKALAMTQACGLFGKFYRHAVKYAVTLLNHTTVSPNTGVTPVELRTGAKPSLKHFETFGADVYYHVPRSERGGIGSHAAPAVYLGTDPARMGSILWCLKGRKLKTRRDVRHFHPPRFGFAHALQGGLDAVKTLLESEVAPEPAGGGSEVNTSHRQGGLEQVEQGTTAAAGPEAMDGAAQQESKDSESASETEQEWEVRRISRHRGEGDERQFLVHWNGQKPNGAPWAASWENETNVAECQALDDYLRAKGLLVSSGSESEDDDDGATTDVSDAQVQAVMAVTYSTLVERDSVDEDELSALLSGAQLESGIQAPTTFGQAIRSREKAQWRTAMDEEMEKLRAQNTWTVLARSDLPRGANVLPVKWVYKVKTHSDGRLDKFKARNTPKGFKQRAGVDFFETYAHTGAYKSFRLLLSLAARWDYELVTMDVPEAFLNATLEENVYVELPLGYGGEEGKIGKLNKALYGIKQGPRRWDETVHPFVVKECGWAAAISDRSLYFKQSRTGQLMLLFRFVDDFKGASHARDHAEMEETIELLRAKFRVKVDRFATQFLGMRITRDRAARTIKLDLSKYITEALARYGLSECKTAETPEVVNGALTKAGTGSGTPCDRQAYMEMTGTLMYAAYACRADIAHAAYALASHMQAPMLEHLTAAKYVLRYLSGTRDVGPVFGLEARSGADSKHMVDLSAFADADWANDKRDRKSISGWAIKLNGDLLSWSSKKQSVVSLSTCEAEMYATGAAVQEVLWLQGMLGELGLRWQADGAVVYGDNQSAIAVAKNGIKSSNALKHVAIKWSFITQAIDDRTVRPKWIATADQQADIFTKALPPLPFKKLRQQLLGC